MPKIEHASDAAVVAGWKAHSATASRRGLRLCRDAARIYPRGPGSVNKLYNATHFGACRPISTRRRPTSRAV